MIVQPPFWLNRVFTTHLDYVLVQGLHFLLSQSKQGMYLPKKQLSIWIWHSVVFAWFCVAVACSHNCGAWFCVILRDFFFAFRLWGKTAPTAAKSRAGSCGLALRYFYKELVWDNMCQAILYSLLIGHYPDQPPQERSRSASSMESFNSEDEIAKLEKRLGVKLSRHHGNIYKLF